MLLLKVSGHPQRQTSGKILKAFKHVILKMEILYNADADSVHLLSLNCILSL